MNALTPRINRIDSNIILDGGMEIWPEGTSRSVVNNSVAYGGVLFRAGNTTTGVTLTNSQQASVPGGTNIPFSNQISKTAAGTLAAGTTANNTYFIEGYDALRMKYQEHSLLFWVKSSVASNRSVSFTNTGNTHSYVQQYNIPSANTWKLIVLRVPALSTCPGTIDQTTGVGLEIKFGIVSGSTYQTSTLGAWQAGLFISGTGEDTTWLTGTNHDFSIAGVMCVPGDWTSLMNYPALYSFKRSRDDIQGEETRSKRYYEKGGYSMNTPALGTGGGMSASAPDILGSFYYDIQYKVEKKATAAVHLYHGSTGAIDTVRNANGGGSIATTYSGNTTTGCTAQGTLPAGSTLIQFGWSAESRY